MVRTLPPFLGLVDTQCGATVGGAHEDVEVMVKVAGESYESRKARDFEEALEMVKEQVVVVWVETLG
jgi:hypothetical protein